MRKMFVRCLLAAVLAGGLALFRGAPGLCAGDEWYDDVGGHWASGYIRLLWEEGVTDGERPYGPQDLMYFRPDRKITRAQFVVLLCKVFQLRSQAPYTPSYPDVPKTYEMLRDKPAWEFIEGALAGGISFVPAGDPFHPDAYTTRADAVEFLVRSLDLAPYAQSLTPAEIQSALGRFRDREEVPDERRASMACAIKLGIINGYEDWSLRPQRYMSRAEAATVVCRSCLIRVSARSDWFSPDGDGVDDTVGFDLTYLKNRGISRWQVSVADSSGATVYKFNWQDTSGQPPLYLLWDGKDMQGKAVPRGTYYYHGWVEDRRGRVFSSVTKPLYVEVHAFQAWVEPSRCVDGDILEIGATTTPRAERVVVSLPGCLQKTLSSPDGGSHWQLRLTMGPPIPLGLQQAVVTAFFPRAQRSVTVPVERAQDLWLTASVDPNPAAWGQNLTLSCFASPPVVRVKAILFGQAVELRPGPSGTWTAALEVPWGIPAGIYPAVFQGLAGGEQVSAMVPVDIRNPETADLIYVLSK